MAVILHSLIKLWLFEHNYLSTDTKPARIPSGAFYSVVWVLHTGIPMCDNFRVTRSNTCSIGVKIFPGNAIMMLTTLMY